MNGTKVVTYLVSHNLPFVGGSSGDAGPTGDLTTTARLRSDLTKLTQPSYSDFATGRAVGQKMPKAGTIGTTFPTSPITKDAQPCIEIDTWRTIRRTTHVPRDVGGCAGWTLWRLNVQFDDADGNVEGTLVESRDRVDVIQDGRSSCVLSLIL